MRWLCTPFLFLAAMTAPIVRGLAQDPTSHLSFGLTVAVNQGVFDGGAATHSGSNAGLAIGAFLRKPIDDTWVFQGELQYATGSANAPAAVAGSRADFAYLEMPLMFRALETGSAEVRPYAEAGPALAFNISCSFSTRDALSQPTECLKRGPVSSTSGVGVGVIGGIGVEVGKFALGVRYDYRLINVGNFENGDLQIVLGYRF